jgi:cytochrome c553
MMRTLLKTHWRFAVVCVLATFVGLLVAGALFVSSGLYSVAASRGHFAITSWLLEFAMRRSVATHSFFISVPSLESPALVRLAAGHFHSGCAPCHGAPGKRSDLIVEHMLPPPPPLSGSVGHWSDAGLFWIVQNGIKYTGMPGWAALERHDEIWAMVAFLRRLPQMQEAEYRRLVRSDAEAAIRDLARSDSAQEPLALCVRCHGDAGRPPASRLVPVISGQSKAYLEASLRQYADGSRQSGIMQPVAVRLDAHTISKIAAHYASLKPVQSDAVRSARREQIQRGQEIATLGIPAKGVPACFACHAGNAATFPRLAGQHADYITGQLDLWRKGLRSRTALGAIMAPVARRLSEQEADEVAAFFESLGTSGSPEVSGDGPKSPGRS